MPHDSFLAAIRAAPADDLPRLVLADWLEEHGDAARAEFIRVQCDLARLADVDPHRPALEDRAHELLAAHEPDWLGFPPDAVTEWEFARGFVDQTAALSQRLSNPALAAGLARHPVRRLSLGGTAFVARTDDEGPADRLVEAARGVLAGVEELDFDGWMWPPLDALPLFAPGVMPRLRSLSVPGFFGPDMAPNVLRVAAATPNLTALDVSECADDEQAPPVPDLLAALAPARLLDLGVSHSLLTSADLLALLAPPTLSSLTTLDVSDNPLGADAWRAFHGADRGLRLARLDVSGTPLAGVSLEPLLASPALRDTLADFEMNRCGSARRNLEVVADSGFWARATSLRLHSGTIPTMAFEPLCLSAGPAGLRLLDVADNYLRAPGVRMLSESAWAGGLTWLALSRNYLDDDAVEALAGSERFTNLRTLHLAHNRVSTQLEHTEITDAGAAALARAPSLARLRILTVSYTAVTDRGAAVLLDGPHWRLSGLGVGGLGLSARAAATFAQSPRLARLEWLDLADNPGLGGDALLPLAESPHLSPLCELDVGGVPVSERVRDALRARLGGRLSV